jgi:NAD(P)-dependent dehydrogenase (short-subunit alcohol dehydrogenase family)
MSQFHRRSQPSSILIIAASRGLGHAIAAEFLEKGWNVVGTTRPGRPNSTA